MASRDYESASRITRRFEILRLTKTHARFANMGGFQFRVVSTVGIRDELFSCDGNGLLVLRDKCYRVFEEIRNKITEDEIEDRSKADSLSYMIALWQITWTFIRLVARWAYHQQLALVEWTALPFMTSGIITYSLLWNKPQDVGCPVTIELNTQLTYEIKKDLNEFAAQTGDDSYKRSRIPYNMRNLETRQLVAVGLAALGFHTIHCIA